MTTNPVIVVGDIITNIPPDTIRVAYTKYNSHFHTIATLDNFSYYPFEVGDKINLFNNNELILENTRILKINNNLLELENNTTNDLLLNNCSIEIVGKGIIIPNITVPIRTNNLILNKVEGFVDSSTIEQSKTSVIVIVNKDYNLNERILLIPPDLFTFFRIKKIIVNCTSDGLTSIILNKLNTSLSSINNNTISINNKKGKLEINEYRLGDNFTYFNKGLGITPIGTFNPPFTISLELITL